MQYRARFIAANFLTKILGVSWQLGQEHFARLQIDYDWSINDGNWHWVASMAMYAPRYSLYTFDPKHESKLYDPDAQY